MKTIILSAALLVAGAGMASAAVAPTEDPALSAITIAAQTIDLSQAVARRGADDGVNHDANDDNHRNRHRRGRGGDDDRGGRGGHDDGPNHDLNDDHGGDRGKGGRGRGRGGHDDGPNHTQLDLGPLQLASHGADDGPDHDVGDDHGGRRGGKGGKGGKGRGGADDPKPHA